MIFNLNENSIVYRNKINSSIHALRKIHLFEKKYQDIKLSEHIILLLELGTGNNLNMLTSGTRHEKNRKLG